jgi:hypothetical protein
MKKIIIGILVMMLLITTTLLAVGTKNIKIDSNNLDKTIDLIPILQNGVDQEQTSQCGRGFFIKPTQWLAQGFKPTVTKLTAVQLYIFKHDNPPVNIQITVSIRDSLEGNDLTVISVNADQIEDYKWVSFDFPDIEVTPEQQYYIICRSDGGEGEDCYCWFYENDNPYTRGDGWMSFDDGLSWEILSGTQTNDADFCFKTWYTESKNKRYINSPFQNFLKNYPILFQLLQQLLRL